MPGDKIYGKKSCSLYGEGAAGQSGRGKGAMFKTRRAQNRKNLMRAKAPANGKP